MTTFEEAYNLIEPLFEQITAKYTDTNGNVDEEKVKEELIASLEEAEEYHYLNQICHFETDYHFPSFTFIKKAEMDTAIITDQIVNIIKVRDIGAFC